MDIVLLISPSTTLRCNVADQWKGELVLPKTCVGNLVNKPLPLWFYLRKPFLIQLSVPDLIIQGWLFFNSIYKCSVCVENAGKRMKWFLFISTYWHMEQVI